MQKIFCLELFDNCSLHHWYKYKNMSDTYMHFLSIMYVFNYSFLDPNDKLRMTVKLNYICKKVSVSVSVKCM